ncbi:two-component system, sensor histidine kinase YesM [Pelagirhabdus alkalitolerans]|uniref:histidine kinase n=1 Tax=Pelagirhabdus alkalitolerans TaxID=1612202 RepID=A0A1G6KWG8_9BACI|nr:sensor histidine kinase [Pelagirhabdus alkalitolerans]SDC35452.1 two-component system, sensor histidine kinase YesM [Pelagirhabdus alkalitolerans]
MKRFEKVKQLFIRNGLFIKLFSVTLFSILLVSIFITFSTIRVSTDLFMETFSITNSKIIQQITTQFNSYSATVASTINEIENNGVIKRVLSEEEMDSVTLSRSYFQINQELDRIYTSLQAFDANLIVTGQEDRLYNLSYIYWPVTKYYLDSLEMTERTFEEPRAINYHALDTAVIEDEVIVATKALTERLSDDIYGAVYVSIRESQLRDFYEGYTSEGNDVVLIDQDGQIISSSQSDLMGTVDTNLRSIAESTYLSNQEHTSVDIEGREHLLISEYLPGFDMYLINLIDRQQIVSSLINTREILMISGGIILLALVMVWFVTRRITKSLTRLVRQISKIAQHNFSERINETGGYESRQIAQAFNHTLDELQTYVGIVVESQKRQQRSELKSLQHQINPHFLYNTLTTVKFMVKQGDPEEAMSTIHALITLLQSTLGEFGETITVSKEIENTKNYVTINQARYGDRIKVNYFIAPDCESIQVPKLILQPFIENAFFHAFNQKKSGFIQILIRKQESRLLAEVVDDGDGMTLKTEELPHDNKKKRQLFSGIGMRNVHERIQLMYGKDYGVSVSSEIGKGTRITIELPIIDEDQHTDI